MTVVICTLNSKYVHCSTAPWCLLAGIETHCQKEIRGAVVDGTINQPVEQVLARITDLKPQVVGFCCYIWNIGQTKRLISLLKSRAPDVITVLGGPEVSYNAMELLKSEQYIDYIISGEGEKPFALLLNDIYNGQKPRNIPGLCYRENDKTFLSPPHIGDGQSPSPYAHGYLGALNRRIAYIETSRGCPFGCAYCLSGRCGKVRYFDLDRVKDEILLLANSGTETIKFVDRTFNSNAKRAFELFSFIIGNYKKSIPDGIRFHFEIAGDLLDNQTLELLSTAPSGAIQLEIGLQSFNAKTLEAVNRKTDVSRLTANIKRLVSSLNIHIHIDLIAGLPFEDYDSFADGFNKAFSLKPHMLQLGFLKLLHGSPMRENPGNFPCRYNEKPPYEIIDTPWITKKQLQYLHTVEDALQRLYNSGRFGRTLQYLLSNTGYTPFQLLGLFGEHCEKKKISRISLDDYTELAFKFFSDMPHVDKTALRDAMVCDRLSTNRSGMLPSVLMIKDKDMEKKLKSLRLNSKKGVKRGAAYLYSERCAVYADYIKKNPVTGEYPLNKIFEF